MLRRSLLVLAFFVLGPCLAFGGAIVRSAAGLTPASIQPAVDQFRVDLGSANNGVGGTFPSGHREINWDGVPDSFSAPNNLPANFFNSNSPRGAVFASGTPVQVSAKVGNPTVTAVRFGNINPNYPNDFQTFSPERLFAAIGTNVTDVLFFVPGTSTAAYVNGFGAVFTDVDLPTSTTLQFFDPNGISLGTFSVPALFPGSQTLSFLGVSFNAGEKVARVRITAGNAPFGFDDNPAAGIDAVAMDDFLYGEPQSLQTSCSTDSTTLCLNGGRFRVQVVFRAPFMPFALPGTALGLTSDSGTFSFFTSNNLELLVKVVDGRPFNGKFWVFIGSTTNVEFTVTVTDTTNNAVRTYTNAQGNIGTIVDLAAF